MIEEEKKNRMVSIMNMHAVKCLLTIFGGGKGIPGRLTRLLQGVRGLRVDDSPEAAHPYLYLLLDISGTE